MQVHPQFIPSGFFAFRTPLLPFDELQRWSEGNGASAVINDLTALEAALTADRAHLRQRLQTLLSRPEIRDAIFVASPDLTDGLTRWQQDPESEKGQRAESALVRYFARMTGRATPFGLFAGCSVGKIAEATHMVLPARSTYQRHTRLDMDYLFALADTLTRDRSLREALSYRPNSSLYHVADRIRYAEARLQGKQRSYHLVAVEENDYLNATLARASNGATPEALAAALVADDPDIALEEAEAYLDELIDSQLLVPDLTLTVTGPEPIHAMIAQLQALQNGAPTAVITKLVNTLTALADLDAAGLGAPAETYRAIAQELAELPTKVEMSRLFQVDMVKPVVTATLSQPVLDEIVRGVALLHRLIAPNQDGLSRFRDAFVARYETQEIPLVEALDEEMGIGYDAANGQGGEVSPLLAGLALREAGGRGQAEPTTPWSARHSLLLRKLEKAQQSGAQSIEITEADLAKLGTRTGLPLPNSFSVMANIAAASEEALNSGEFQLHLHGVSGPSGARLLGRFCHADPELQMYVEQHLAAEEALNPDAIFAEVVHLPEGRIGNILCRPVLRHYEIPFLGRSSADPEYQIPITDLMIAVVQGKIILRSKRLGRQVIPRLTSAHNYSYRGLGIYKFLCALQNQGVAAGLGWDWGALGGAAFLPRVTSGRLVLERARWLATAEELKSLSAARATARYQAVQSWRTERKLPRFIVVADGDNELPVDLDNVLSIESFIDLVKGRNQVTLFEMFPSPDQLFAHSPEGRFMHEIVAPFVRSEETRRQGEGEARREGDRETGKQEIRETLQSPPHPISLSPCLPLSLSFPRRFAPGSEWLYAKLYTGAATADQLLREVIAPVVAEQQLVDGASPWFFIRYSDPEWHLRVRFQGDRKRLMGELMPALYTAAAPLLENGKLWRIQLDTYEREVERYGGPHGMALAERLFHADSEAVLAIVERLSGDAGADARWRLALRGIDLLLADLGFDAAAKHTIIKKARDGFAAEFGVDKQGKGKLGEKFRNERKSLETLLAPAWDADHPLAPGFAILQQRSVQIAPVAAELRACEEAGHLQQPLALLAQSYIHMHANRLLRSSQRAQELVLYDLLERYYESQEARLRQVNKPNLSAKIVIQAVKASSAVEPLAAL